MVLAPEGAAEADKRRSSVLTESILKVARANPGVYAKGALATAVKGTNWEKILAEIDRLIAAGVLGHDKDRYGPHKLVVKPEGETVQF